MRKRGISRRSSKGSWLIFLGGDDRKASLSIEGGVDLLKE